MALRTNLKKDLAGERKAIRDYGKRIAQTSGTPLAATLREIKDDEEDHQEQLSASLRGLKNATPRANNDEDKE